MQGKYFISFDGAKIYYHKTVKDKNRWLIFLHGFGGMVTIFLGAKFPHLAKGLVLVDTSYKPPFIGENFVAKALRTCRF